MRCKLFHIFLFFLCLFGVQDVLYAQDNPDDIALNNDQLENDFYEAVKQRAIENYDKAIRYIQNCIELDPNNAALYYELGKNNLDLKRYPEAEQAFQKAIELDANQRWYWNGLYDVYYQTKNFDKSIPVVKKLIEFDANMNEDLVSLYMYTNQQEKAYALLKKMQESMILSGMMEYYRLKIEDARGDQDIQADKLEHKISSNPKDEENYIKLMMLYSSQNEDDKAFEVAKELAKNIPTSDWAHINLFKFYLQEDKAQDAINSMNKVFANQRIDIKIKHRMLNEFLIYAVKNNSYYEELNTAVDYFENDKTVNVAKELGKFFYSKAYFDKATFYFEKALANDPNDFESVTLLLDNYINANNYEALATRSVIFIDLFPSQPKLYYYAGLANNKLNKSKEAIEFLETGLDFLVENTELELYFYIQLVEAYNKAGNQNKANSYLEKAEELNKSKK